MVPRTDGSAKRGAGTELWLLRPGSDADLDERLRGFAAAPPVRVHCPPAGRETAWAARFAALGGGRPVPLPELAAPADGEARDGWSQRLWQRVEQALVAGHPRCLVVAEDAGLCAIVARALSLSREGAASLGIEPGRLVLLRDDPDGLVLRRYNVVAPESETGTALTIAPEPVEAADEPTT